MPDVDPLRASAQLDIGSMQASLDQLSEAVQAASEKMRSSFQEAGTSSKEHLKNLEEESKNLGDELKSLGANFYENIHTPLGELHERMLPFLEDLSGSTIAVAALGAAVVVVGGELMHMADEFANNAMELQVQSKMYGMSTEQLQLFRDESERLGLGAESAAFGLRSLTRAFTTGGDAMSGMGLNTGQAEQVMRQYGITGNTVQEKMMSLLNVIHNTSDEGERQAIVLGLVGTRGLMLLPVLEDLADRGYSNVKEEMKAVGVLLDEQQIKAGVEAHDAVFDLKEAWEGLKTELEESVLSAFTEIVKGLTTAIEKTKSWGEALASLGEKSESTFKLIETNFKQLEVDLPLVTSYYSTLYSWIGKAADALVRWNVGVDKFIYNDLGFKVFVEAWEKVGGLVEKYKVPAAPPPPAAPAAPDVSGMLQTTGTSVQTQATNLINAIQEADKEGVKHIETLQKHSAEIRTLAQEMGENAPVEIKKFANQLKEVSEQQAQKFNQALQKIWNEANKTGDELIKSWDGIYKSLDKANRDVDKQFEKEDEESLKNRTKLALEFIKRVHESRQEDINSQEAIGKEELKGEQDNLKFLEDTHQLTAAQDLQRKKDLAAKELQIESDKIKAEIELAKLSPNSENKVQALNAKLLLLEKQYQVQVQQIDEQAIVQRQKNIEKFFNQMKSGMDTAINGWLQGTQTLSQAWTKAIDGMLVGLAKMLEQMLVQWIEHLAMREALQQQADLKQSLRTAYAAAKLAFKSAMDLPFPVNVVMAPTLAATAFAGVMELGSAAKGMVVPHDNFPAVLHAKEMVLPQHISTGLESMINGGGKGSESHFHYAPQVHAMDAEGVDRVLTKHRRLFVREMQAAQRAGQI